MRAFDYQRQPKVAVPVCPVCATPNNSATAVDRWDFLVGISQCTCGLKYLNPRMTEAAYAEFYRDHYRPLVREWELRAGTPLPIEPFQRQHGRSIGRLAHDILKRNGGRGLDVGGGTGAVLDGFSECVKVSVGTVVDPNTTELETASAKGYQTHAGTLESLPDGEWDVILCSQTVDHVCDPLAGLRNLRSKMAAQGWLWIDIALKTLIKIDHPLYWSVPSFKQALRMTGWRIASTCDDGTHRGFICEGA